MKKSVVLSLFLMLNFITLILPNAVFATKDLSVAIYGGPGTPTPLSEILIGFNNFKLVPQWNTTLAINQVIFTENEFFAIEIEGQWSWYFDSQRPSQSFQAASILRWLDLPWSKIIESSFALGLGLSYANSIPKLENDTLEKQSKILVHLLFEYAFSVKKDWDLLLRIQHRSGAFGLINGVVGGSDYLCLGVRYGNI